MTFLRQIPAVAAKELLVEWRQRSRTTSLFFFAVALLLMVAFAMPSVDRLADIAGGALWIGLLLASTRSLDASFHVELENGSLEGLVLWPVDPRAVYYGKAVANALILLLVGIALLPVVLVLYNPPVSASTPEVLAVLALGSAALAAPGTLVAALTTQARGSSTLLPLLLFPLVVPVLMAASRATSLALEGDPMDQVDDWLGILLVFNVVHWALDGVFFTRVVEEG